MSLDFPNSIRRYEPARGCVSFWGSEASLEVMFQIELDVLRTLSPAVIDGSEGLFLVAFDLNRSAMHQEHHWVGYLICDTETTDPSEFSYKILLQCEGGIAIELAITNWTDRYMAVVGRPLPEFNQVA